MNKEMILKVADAIEADQKNAKTAKLVFDMENWGLETECGTVACVAGYCIALEVPNLFSKVAKLRPGVSFISGGIAQEDFPSAVAKRLMGLETNEADDLFTPFGMIGTINRNASLVPDALRWMALNEKINWEEALASAACLHGEKVKMR